MKFDVHPPKINIEIPKYDVTMPKFDVPKIEPPELLFMKTKSRLPGYEDSVLAIVSLIVSVAIGVVQIFL